MSFAAGLVIPVAPGREANVRRVLMSVSRLDPQPAAIVVVMHGWEDGPGWVEPVPTWDGTPVRMLDACVNGEHPRNVGVRAVRAMEPLTHVWFLDSDVMVAPGALAAYQTVAESARARGRILIGPYEWLPEGTVDPDEELRNDPRRPLFDRQHQDADLLAVAAFSGNIVWPGDVFEALQFDARLPPSRNEDLDLGIRAAKTGHQFAVVPDARGWHLWHDREVDSIYAANAWTVPLIYERHRAWLDERAFVLTDHEGARLDYCCPGCDMLVHPHLIWSHECPETVIRSRSHEPR